MNTFKDIYSTYYKDIFKYAFYLCKDYDSANDLTSETFLKSMTVNTKLNVNTIKSYLFKITYRLYLNDIRYKSNLENYSKEYNKAGFINSVSLSNDTFQQIETIISKISDADKTLFYLKIYGELSYQEISEITELSISNLKIKIHRIRKRILEKVKEHES